MAVNVLALMMTTSLGGFPLSDNTMPDGASGKQARHASCSNNSRNCFKKTAIFLATIFNTSSHFFFIIYAVRVGGLPSKGRHASCACLVSQAPPRGVCTLLPYRRRCFSRPCVTGPFSILAPQRPPTLRFF